MADSNFIGRYFAGLDAAEKQTLDTLQAAFQHTQMEFKAARVALQDYEGSLRSKYALLPSTPFAIGDLASLRAAETTSAESRQAAAAAVLSTATDEEKAKHAAWVAAGRPMRKIGVSPNVG